MKKYIFIAFLFFYSYALAADPIIFYSDLISGPQTGGLNNKGVFVTIVGKNFGALQGTSTITVGGGAVDNYPVWSDTKVSFQLGASAATGNIVITVDSVASNGIAFTVRAGNIYFIDDTGNDEADGSVANPWLDFENIHTNLVAGDTLYWRAGTWTGFRFQATTPTGTVASPIALVAYPGETVNITDLDDPAIRMWGPGTTEYHDYVIAGFVVTSDRPMSLGNTYNMRIINNVLKDADYYGAIEVSSAIAGYDQSNFCVYGNTVSNCNTNGTWTAAENNYSLYQGIYFGGGDGVANVTTDNIDVSWNTVYNFGSRGIQFNNDEEVGAAGNTFTNIKISNNLIYNGNRDAIRISTGTVSANVFNNIIYDCGLYEFGGLGIISWTTGSTINIYNNTIYSEGNDGYGVINIMGDVNTTADYVFKNNIIYSLSSSDYLYYEGEVDSGSVDMDNDCYYGNGNGPAYDTNRVNADPLFTTNGSDFHLQATSPCRDAGVDLSAVFTTDYDGVSRPSVYDIGAYEYPTIEEEETPVAGTSTSLLGAGVAFSGVQ